MKVLTVLILSCSVLATGLLFAQQNTCTCKNCKCTAESHCGCCSQQGCKCKDHNSCNCNCSCGDRLLSLNVVHHGNLDENTNEESES